ncbi:MAG: 4-hydroxythreonine-4-phosphate dehydrogenase PdxA [Nitrospinales bacterium]
MEHLPRIAVTMGDPAGIGPEIIVKGFQSPPTICNCIIVGDAQFLSSVAEKFAPDLSIFPIKNLDEADFSSDALNILDLKNVSGDLQQGIASTQSGKAAVEYIERATELALQNKVDAIVTAPINKEGMHLAGYQFPGHTEFLAKLTNSSDSALLMSGGELRVVLATTHVPLNGVKELITEKLVLDKIRLTHQWLVKFVKEQPKIAVAALNPHGGEGGIFGDEEMNDINPAIETARTENIDVTGPWSADALFARVDSSDYDAVITMYHDQGMIPIKMASMGQAVNITLGLPIIRTSVDHGTAYDIVGKGEADPGSLMNAINTAAHLADMALSLK